jgi:hypothetical protein
MFIRTVSLLWLQVFISDGLNDRYIPHFITADTDSANELPLITVTAVSFFIDTYLADLYVKFPQISMYKGFFNAFTSILLA